MFSAPLRDHGDVTDGTHYKDLETNLARYRSKEVLFLLIRDPRDLVVCLLFLCHRTEGRVPGFHFRFRPEGDLFSNGDPKDVTFYRSVDANRHVPEMLLPIGYDVCAAIPVASAPGLGIDRRAGVSTRSSAWPLTTAMAAARGRWKGPATLTARR